MNKKLTGTVLATAIAGLVLGGNAIAGEGAGHSHEAGKTVKCSGANECKGKGACASADHACGGKNGCKGKGWVKVESEKDCTDKGGTVVKS